MNRINQEHAIAFMKGGKARFVLHSLKSDVQYRYRIREMDNGVYWVYFEKMNGIYIGHINRQNKFSVVALQLQLNSDEARAVELFKYCWEKLQTLEVPERLHILHLGNCSFCGRKLKDAKSLELGIGPECLKRIS